MVAGEKGRRGIHLFDYISCVQIPGEQSPTTLTLCHAFQHYAGYGEAHQNTYTRQPLDRNHITIPFHLVAPRS